MKIEKTNESITRVYTNGEPKDTVNNAVYEIRDDGGRRMGDLNVNSSGSYSISMAGTCPSIEEAVAEVKRLFNITE